MTAGLGSVGVVGAGKVGTALATALVHAGVEVVAASARTKQARDRLATTLPGIPVVAPPDVVERADVVLLAVPDHVLPELAAELRAVRPEQAFVHTSGRYGAQVLAPLAAQHARTAAVHPAMTFPGDPRDGERLAGAAFGVTAADEPSRALAATLVETLGGVVQYVAEDARTTYHAALAHGANHLVTLLNDAVDGLRAAGVEDPQLVLRSLAEAALANAFEYGDAALTGPVVRGDVEAVTTHLEALRERAPQIAGSYAELARRTAERAADSGRLDPAAAGGIITAVINAAQPVT